jgi:hypothetical protein
LRDEAPPYRWRDEDEARYSGRFDDDAPRWQEPAVQVEYDEIPWRDREEPQYSERSWSERSEPRRRREREREWSEPANGRW